MSQEISVRRLNERGITVFSSVEWGPTGSAGDPPSEILLDDDYSELVIFSDGETRRVDQEAAFDSFLELADVIDECLGPSMDLKETEGDRGLWSWFSLLFYNRLRKGEPGSWSGAAMPRFIPSGQSFSSYRHQVYAPYALKKLHGKEASVVFLWGETNNWPDVNEQLLNTAAIVSSTPLIATASLLYYDQVNKNTKMYAASKEGQGPYNGDGSARRLRTVFWQLYETYNLRSMTAEEIVQLLPSEFDHFKNDGEEE